MKVELKFTSERSRITAYCLGRKYGRKKKFDWSNERATVRFLEKAIKLLVAETVNEEFKKDIEARGLNITTD